MFMGINSKSAVGSNFDKIYIYKYIHSSAKFVNAKMFSATGQLAVLKSMVIDKSNGYSFYSGQVIASSILVTAGQTERFVMMLDASLNYIFFRTFQGSTSAYAKSICID